MGGWVDGWLGGWVGFWVACGWFWHWQVEDVECRGLCTCSSVKLAVPRPRSTPPNRRLHLYYVQAFLFYTSFLLFLSLFLFCTETAFLHFFYGIAFRCCTCVCLCVCAAFVAVLQCNFLNPPPNHQRFSPLLCESSKFLFQAASGSVALVVAQLRSGNCRRR